MKQKILVGVSLLILLGCIAFALVVINTGITVPQDPKSTSSEPVDVRGKERAMVAQLRTAPWQGLRFLSNEREWRFYAVAGEQRQIDLVEPFDLIKAYFLQADGELSFTWAALGFKIPGQEYVSVSDANIQPGDLIEVVIKGDYVTQNGVYWEDCDSDYCHLAQMIDTILILDDRGTGITNGFIRYGWQPPASPMYGFLCWKFMRFGMKPCWLLGRSERSVWNPVNT